MRGVIVGLLALPLLFGGCSDRATGSPARQATPAPVPVGVAEVVQRQVPVQVAAVGNVQASTTVAVRSQVAGQIDQVKFTEGHDVRKGDLLFVIDQRPFETALRQAEAAQRQREAEVAQAQANLARDLAQLENWRVQEQRYRTLVERELVAREQYDQVRTNAAAMDATVNADRAAVDNTHAAANAAKAAVDTARLLLAYTTIHAPMDGRTGNLLVQRGNTVKGNDDNPLVMLMQVRPIYVSFAVPEHYLASIKEFRARGVLKVEARVPNQTPATGDLTFINNTVDPTTGTIQLKATFTNGDAALWPGQFVEVTLTLHTETAVVVPSQAVQASQQGSIVFVVKPDLTVESRKVEVGRRVERDVIITRGVAPGERVVTDGQLRLVPGAKIEIKPPRAS
ncbi:MAG: efflux RND transporter periplasmic adaptor subunit [Candidatus Rokubacteria bacterium]|nr:efflux RND transporter periplasmic adaptor subunit [Candidatus Rokubacteria bacterium]